MCGISKRFTDADYTVPKFVLDVDGVPMYAAAVNSLQLTVEHQLYFVVNKSVCEEYNLIKSIKAHFPQAIVIELVQATRGFAQTVMRARQYIAADNPCLIVCCDQIVEYDSVAYNEMLEDESIDGSLLTFTDCSSDPKWTYARIDLMDNITRVACKQPISSTPIVGIYHWRDGIAMYRDIRYIMKQGITTNNEFYVCDAVSRAIDTAKNPWKAFEVTRMIPLGTPEDYEAYTNNNI